MKPENPQPPFHDPHKSVILVVTRNGHLTESVMDYGLGVAKRLNHQLLVAHVNTLPLLWDGGKRNRRFAVAVQESVASLQKKARAKDIVTNCIKETGKIAKVISRLCRIVKKIDFIIIDKDIKMEEAISRSPVPVFNVFTHEYKTEDCRIKMADQTVN